MAEVKWIKIYTDMVSNKKIKRIRTLPEGNNIVLIWVFLLAQAGECNKSGALYLTDTLPFRAEDLAIEFDYDVTVINLALITLERFSMIEVFDEIIYIKNWNEYQNIEGMDKIREQTKKRVTEYRERKRIEAPADVKKCAYCGGLGNTTDHIIPISKRGTGDEWNLVDSCKSCNSSKKDKDLADFLNDSVLYHYQNVKFDLVLRNEKLMKHVDFIDNKFIMKRFCNVTVTQGNATELELDLELEREKEKDKKSNSGNKHSPQNIFGVYQREIGELSEIIAEKLIDLELTYSEEWVKQAIKVAVMQGIKKLSYIEGTLKKWKLLNHVDPWMIDRKAGDNVVQFTEGIRQGFTNEHDRPYEEQPEWKPPAKYQTELPDVSGH